MILNNRSFFFPVLKEQKKGTSKGRGRARSEKIEFFTQPEARVNKEALFKNKEKAFRIPKESETPSHTNICSGHKPAAIGNAN